MIIRNFILAGRSSSAAHLSRASLIDSGNLTLITAIGSGARGLRPAFCLCKTGFALSSDFFATTVRSSLTITHYVIYYISYDWHSCDIGQSQLPAVKSQDHALAETELTGVRRAAITAGHRMAALERDAEAIHTKTLLSCTARVVSTQERGVHALITDDNGVTVEISGGDLMASVASPHFDKVDCEA